MSAWPNSALRALMFLLGASLAAPAWGQGAHGPPPVAPPAARAAPPHAPATPAPARVPAAPGRAPATPPGLAAGAAGHSARTPPGLDAASRSIPAAPGLAKAAASASEISASSSGESSQAASSSSGTQSDATTDEKPESAGAGAAKPDEARAKRAAFARAHPDLVEIDEQGWLVARGRVVALSPSLETLKRAQAAGFQVSSEGDLGDLGDRVVVLAAPSGLNAREALKRLTEMDPTGRFGLDHLFEPNGAATKPIPGGAAGAASSSAPSRVRVGMIDTGVALGSPALMRAGITQEAFAEGAATPRPHGTAVASLIVGQAAGFRGAAPGARLYAADVFGAGPVGGSTVSIARGLAWMTKNRVPVVNLSLVGPDDAILRRVVETMVRRGYLIVAPAGNDGPAAPAAYPASYPGVVSVTAVDARGRVLPEAGRPLHIEFAAPGADMAAASLDGYAEVRGTSYAAALVTGGLANFAAEPAPLRAERAKSLLARTGRELRLSLGSIRSMVPLVAEAQRTNPQSLAVLAVSSHKKNSKVGD